MVDSRSLPSHPPAVTRFAITGQFRLLSCSEPGLAFGLPADLHAAVDPAQELAVLPGSHADAFLREDDAVLDGHGMVGGMRIPWRSSFSILWQAVSKCRLSFSTPMNFRPVRMQAIPVVPLPMNGS